MTREGRGRAKLDDPLKEGDKSGGGRKFLDLVNIPEGGLIIYEQGAPGRILLCFFYCV